MATVLFGSREARLERIEANLEWEASLPLQTPEERDMAIYEAIYVDLEKAWKVARRYKIAPATAANIARQTRDRLARREHEFYKLRKNDALGERRAQYESMARELKEAWTESKDGRSTLHISSPDVPMRETIRNKGLGDVRYLNLLFKVRKEIDAIEDRWEAEGDAASPSRERERPEFVAAEQNGQHAEEPALAAQPLTPDPSPPRGEGRKKKKKQSRRAKHLAKRTPVADAPGLGRFAGDIITALPEGVSTGSQELDRQLLAILQEAPFPAEPCGCGQ